LARLSGFPTLPAAARYLLYVVRAGAVHQGLWPSDLDL